MITYVIQMDGPMPLVKFGRSRNIKSRLSTLSTGVPWTLRVVCLLAGDMERTLKQRFKAHHVKGEWFEPTPELQSWLDERADEGKTVRQVKVDQAYINAVLKPRIKEYLNGREPENNTAGDLVRCIFADLLPSLEGRQSELVKATKGHVTTELVNGYGPAPDRPHLIVFDAATTAQAGAAA